MVCFLFSLYAQCKDYERDPKGKCPGEAGYRPSLREAPTDFAAYQAQMKAKKAGAGAAVSDGKCKDYERDPKGKCPGEAGYRPSLREAPTDFAAYQAQLKAKKAAEGK